MTLYDFSDPPHVDSCIFADFTLYHIYNASVREIESAGFKYSFANKTTAFRELFKGLE